MPGRPPDAPLASEASSRVAAGAFRLGSGANVDGVYIEIMENADRERVQPSVIEDGEWFVAQSDAFPAANGQGRTREEAIASFWDAVELIREDQASGGALPSAADPRAGWEESFAELHRDNGDVLLDGEQLAASSWDDEEWEWEDPPR